MFQRLKGIGNEIQCSASHLKVSSSSSARSVLTEHCYLLMAAQWSIGNEFCGCVYIAAGTLIKHQSSEASN